MRQHPRKSTPKVKKGKVQKKNNHQETPNYWNTRQPEVIVDKEKPGEGFRHYLTKQDVLNFIALIPNWYIISKGLNAIILDSGNQGCDGWYEFSTGVIGICAWPKDLSIEMDNDFFFAHRELFERLDIHYTIQDRDLGCPWYYEERGEVDEARKYAYNIICEFTPNQVKAYQLLHILLHELGHHYDLITTKSKRRATRGEQFAEDYAFEHEAQIWQNYLKKFPLY
ncbi:hypothetical protein BKI52_45295 [marine bacterium AO1-C]|nr:hypothetical protein BKI52_45295 [marine bacterium AO1-C]